MLKTIEIKNYLLIEDIKVNFERNFNIITGETGSGKSIVIGALNLLVGSRIDHKVVGPRNKKCVIEAIFIIDDKLKDNFLNFDLDFENESFFRREILSNGKFKSKIDIEADYSSKVAKEKIEKVGGQITLKNQSK